MRPLWLTLAYTAFMAVLVPVYLREYGPTNFVYFCDAALLLTLVGMWTGSRLMISMAAVGILAPQALWLADFAGQMAGVGLVGMTDYMFDDRKPLFLRGLSLFHGWLPVLLVVLVRREGYDRRAWWAWTWLAWALLLVSYFALPAPGSHPEDPNLPVNVNYVHGPGDERPQGVMPGRLYFVLLMAGLPVLAFLPAHLLLARVGRGRDGAGVRMYNGARAAPSAPDQELSR